MSSSPAFKFLFGLIPVWFLLKRLSYVYPRRLKQVPVSKERVLILGASSGIGRALAHKYASRAAYVCVVGRRQELVESVKRECIELGASGVIATTGNFAQPADMVSIHDRLEKEWNGLDTLIVAAGVSSLRPLMELTEDPSDKLPHTTRLAGIERARDISHAAAVGNFHGPLVSAVAFIPLLEKTSKAPAILLVSSLAAVVPAPTRALYCATKSASLLLYQALSIEHPHVTFSTVLPSTVEGDFRQGAVDGGSVREENPSKNGLKREHVAERCIQAIDQGEKQVFMPAFMKLAPFLYWLLPSFIEEQARKKYRFSA